MNPRQLLFYCAQEYSRERRSFSREEIQHQINGIKYLSAQKKVPRLTLRKEILHLEHKLQSVYELEKKLTTKERKESLKVSSLKKQIQSLQQRLSSCEEKDLHAKVDRLSHLLADHHAKQKIARDVTVQTTKWVKPKLVPAGIQTLSQRLQKAKEKLASTPGNDDLQQKIVLLEQKLNQMLGNKIEETVSANPPEIKHTIKFDSPLIVDKSEMEAEKELPLPPPLRLKKKN